MEHEGGTNDSNTTKLTSSEEGGGPRAPSYQAVSAFEGTDTTEGGGRGEIEAEEYEDDLQDVMEISGVAKVELVEELMQKLVGEDADSNGAEEGGGGVKGDEEENDWFQLQNLLVDVLERGEEENQKAERDSDYGKWAEKKWKELVEWLEGEIDRLREKGVSVQVPKVARYGNPLLSLVHFVGSYCPDGSDGFLDDRNQTVKNLNRRGFKEQLLSSQVSAQDFHICSAHAAAGTESTYPKGGVFRCDPEIVKLSEEFARRTFELRLRHVRGLTIIWGKTACQPFYEPLMKELGLPISKIERRQVAPPSFRGVAIPDAHYETYLIDSVAAGVSPEKLSEKLEGKEERTRFSATHQVGFVPHPLAALYAPSGSPRGFGSALLFDTAYRDLLLVLNSEASFKALWSSTKQAVTRMVNSETDWAKIICSRLNYALTQERERQQENPSFEYDMEGLSQLLSKSEARIAVDLAARYDLEKEELEGRWKGSRWEGKSIIARATRRSWLKGWITREEQRFPFVSVKVKPPHLTLTSDLTPISSSWSHFVGGKRALLEFPVPIPPFQSQTNVIALSSTLDILAQKYVEQSRGHRWTTSGSAHPVAPRGGRASGSSALTSGLDVLGNLPQAGGAAKKTEAAAESRVPLYADKSRQAGGLVSSGLDVLSVSLAANASMVGGAREAQGVSPLTVKGGGEVERPVLSSSLDVLAATSKAESRSKAVESASLGAYPERPAVPNDVGMRLGSDLGPVAIAWYDYNVGRREVKKALKAEEKEWTGGGRGAGKSRRPEGTLSQGELGRKICEFSMTVYPRAKKERS
ncbi:hypothetical protein JCM5350_005025 [Sporobolomyces pararoseus]